MGPSALDRYLERLAGPGPERALVERVPWFADATVQPADALVRTLAGEARRLVELALPRVSVVLLERAVAARHRDELLASLAAQSHLDWELLDGKDLARATGELVVFLHPDDLLHPQALGIVARHAKANPAVDVFFTHEAKLDADSRSVTDFLSKPDLDELTLAGGNYLGRLTAIRRARVTDFFSGDEHALLLRLAREPVEALRIPLFLAYTRGHAPSVETTRALLRSTYPDATVAAPREGGAHARFRLRFPLPRRATLTVVIPFRDEPDVTIRALASLEKQQHGLELDVRLVDNGSREESTAKVRAWIGARPGHRLVMDPGAFNYGRIHNAAIREHARGELILLMNNDVELVSPDALSVMATHIIRHEKCAFVGLQLRYPDATSGRPDVQHGGMEVLPGFAGSGWFPVGHAHDESEFVNDDRVAFGVTFACAMTRRSTWDALGGLDEVLVPNGFGDADLCARALERGFVNHYLGTLVGLHHESRTRGRALEELETTVLAERHAAVLAHGRLGRLAKDLQGPQGTGRLPLRYRIADRLNDALRTVLGPAHGALKKRLQGPR